VIGSLMACGAKASTLRELAMNLSASEILDISFTGLFKREVFTGAAVGNLTARRSGIEKIEDAPLALAVVASKLTPSDALPAVFNYGDLRLAIQASAAVVGTAPPVTIGTAQYVDGDLACPVPARVAPKLRATRVISLDVSAWDEDTPAHIAAQPAGEWMQQAKRRVAITALEKPASDLYLHLRLPYYANFSREYRQRLYDLAYAQTMASAEKIKALIAA
jgi:NTE family protein